MNYEITDTWRDQSIQAIMFKLRNTTNNQEFTCGVTQVAINDYFRTEDSIEQAQSNFDENTGLIIEKAACLIENDNANEKGYFVITSNELN